jgi:hypothetical protein
MADRPNTSSKSDQAARASEPPVQKPERAEPDVRDESGAIEPKASRPRGKTEDPDKTL